jgi:CheY-like chemotaxis protein
LTVGYPARVLGPNEKGDSSPPTTGGRRGHILVVDDDALAARAVTRLLSSQHDVVDVRSGRDAMERLKAGEHYDLVLCDLMMPEMTGMDLHEEVQRAGLDVAERMIFMTGGAVTEQAVAFMGKLSDRCFEKPFDPNALRTLARGFVR